MILKKDFYNRDTAQVAEDLLGKILNVKTSKGLLRSRIVETEAYLGITDPACHTYNGRKTPRVSSMYLAGGHSYVYLIYGMYYCLNFVTKTEKEPEAVLIRAVEPLGVSYATKKEISTNGPGKLCRFYSITKKDDGLPLWKKESDLFVSDDGLKIPYDQIERSARIGVEYAKEAAQWPLRFYVKGNRFVSRL